MDWLLTQRQMSDYSKLISRINIQILVVIVTAFQVLWAYVWSFDFVSTKMKSGVGIDQCKTIISHLWNLNRNWCYFFKSQNYQMFYIINNKWKCLTQKWLPLHCLSSKASVRKWFPNCLILKQTFSYQLVEANGK